MKRLLTLCVVAAMGAAMIGCEASARIGDDDPDVSRRSTRIESDGDSYKRTTTIRTEDGERTVTREVERD